MFVSIEGIHSPKFGWRLLESTRGPGERECEVDVYPRYWSSTTAATAVKFSLLNTKGKTIHTALSSIPFLRLLLILDIRLALSS